MRIEHGLYRVAYNAGPAALHSVQELCTALRTVQDLQSPTYSAGPKMGGGGGGVTLPICAVIKPEWAVIKSKLGSVKNSSSK